MRQLRSCRLIGDQKMTSPGATERHIKRRVHIDAEDKNLVWSIIEFGIYHSCVRYQTSRTENQKKGRLVKMTIVKENKEKAEPSRAKHPVQTTSHALLLEPAPWFSIMRCPPLASTGSRHALPCLTQSSPLPSPLQELKQIDFSLFYSFASMVVVHMKSSQSC
jgi:hypothetical protein